MDSRLREIEQWVLDAKSDLSACGQEAYIRKLFLLDAEIKAVIKESGLVPEAYSPGLREKRVRRFSKPVLATAASLGVLLLTTTTVLATLALSSVLNRPSLPVSADRLLASPPPATTSLPTPDWRSDAFIPALDGDEQVILTGLPPEVVPLPDGAQDSSPSTPATAPTARTILAQYQPSAVAPAAPAPTPPAGASRPVQREQDATEVTLVALVPSTSAAQPPAAPVRTAAALPPSGLAAPASGGGMQGEIARMANLSEDQRFAEFPDYTPEEPIVNEAKLKLDRLMGVGTNSLVDSVDNSDSDAEADDTGEAEPAKPAAKSKKSK